ncbi:P-loop containing nucleoside triphosphate hydrolase protein [Russula brevipes]|nr:P-loop containing nucleoside triphosphate hydrolase protein [Russula brevipes]
MFSPASMLSTRGNVTSDSAALSTETDNGRVMIVVMGVSGSGKTTLAKALAEALSISFIDADDLHSQVNKDKMSRGVPLTDADRAPWLVSVRRSAVEAVQGNTREMSGVVVACSALKASYREVLRGRQAYLNPDASSRRGAFVEVVSGEKGDTGLPIKGTDGAPPPSRTYFVHPFGPRSVLLERMRRRESHFMKAARSQNPAETGEGDFVEIQLDAKPEEQVLAALEGLRAVGAI